MFARRQMAACTSTPAYTSASELTTGKQSVCTLILRSPKQWDEQMSLQNIFYQEIKKTGQNIIQVIVLIELNHQ